jgi:hypothetical protein
MFKIFKFAVVVLVVIAGMRMFGVTPERLAAEAEDLFRTDHVERTAQRLREEAAKLETAAGPAANDELNRELLAERRRVMEEKAAILEKTGGHILSGDIEALKHDAEENARRANSARVD